MFHGVLALVDDPRRYELVDLTRRETIKALRGVLGAPAAEAAWDFACAEAGVDGSAPRHSHEELLRIAKQLAAAGGLIGVVGNSLWVNLSTAKALAPDPDTPEDPHA